MKKAWPAWWSWDLEFTPHLHRRMEDRDFNEVDLRKMVESARVVVPDIVVGRWIIHAIHRRRPWHIIVGPDEVDHIWVVVSAYPVS